MKLIRVGVDLAKNVFQVHGVDRKEKGVFFVRIRTIRTKNTVMNKNKGSAGDLYKIVDCARMVLIRAQSTIRADGFSSAQQRNPATTRGAN